MLMPLKNSARVAAAVIALLGMGSGISTQVFAADPGSITILSPKDGSDLYVNKDNVLEFEVKLGPQDDHFHVWVDGEKGPAQRALKGSYTLPKMIPGNHAIIVKLVDKGHVPTGPEKSIFVKAE